MIYFNSDGIIYVNHNKRCKHVVIYVYICLQGGNTMSDITYSVRMPEEDRNKLNCLIEEAGLSAKEFMQELIVNYEINKTKEIMPVLEQDLSELQTITRRINNIYVGMGERMNIVIQEKENELQELLTQKDEGIASLEKKLAALEEINAVYNADVQKFENELLECREMATEREENYKNTTDKFEKIVESNQVLIEEYKDKINVLSGTVEEYKGYKTENQKIKDQLQQSEEKLAAVEKQNLKLNDTLEKLKYEIDELNKKHDERIREIKEKTEFQCEKKILQIEMEHQDQVHRLRQEHNGEVKRLLMEFEKKREASEDKSAKEKGTSQKKNNPDQMEMDLE